MKRLPSKLLEMGWFARVAMWAELASAVRWPPTTECRGSLAQENDLFIDADEAAEAESDSPNSEDGYSLVDDACKIRASFKSPAVSAGRSEGTREKGVRPLFPVELPS
jgi:hypothetical protein